MARSSLTRRPASSCTRSSTGALPSYQKLVLLTTRHDVSSSCSSQRPLLQLPTEPLVHEIAKSPRILTLVHRARLVPLSLCTYSCKKSPPVLTTRLARVSVVVGCCVKYGVRKNEYVFTCDQLSETGYRIYWYGLCHTSYRLRPFAQPNPLVILGDEPRR